MSDLRRRLVALESILPRAAQVGDPTAAGTALAKVTAMVEAHGGRREGESLASALARILDVTTAQLTAYLSENGNSRYQTEARQ